MRECCREVLGWIKWRDTDEVVKGHRLKVEMESGDLHYCSLCGKVLGDCPVCGQSYGFPLILFIDGGGKGAIILCRKCFNKLGLGVKLK
jgi:hypothetical protein